MNRSALAAIGLVTITAAALLASAAGCSGLGKAAQNITYAATGDKKLAGIVGGAGTALEGVAPIAYEEEVAIGGAIAVQIVNRFGGEYRGAGNQAAILNKYVNTLGSAIALNSDRPDIPYHFLVLNDDAPNALAAPGGYVFITKGTLKGCRSEAELAGVIGHEIAHVTQKHTITVLQRGKILQGAAQAGAAALEANPEMFAGLVDEATKVIFETGLDQSKEYEADRLGTEFASRVGYNPKGLEGFLQTLGGIVGYKSSVLFKTHPDPAKRIGELEKLMPGYRDRFAFPDVRARLDKVKSLAGLA
ncbi:MAG: M48 family metalloprotease [bacterium]